MTTLVVALAMTEPASGQRDASVPLRPVHTFSIVARDPVTGELGVAVQSHWFNVGLLVPWIEAGVGAVATQSFVDPGYGKLGLELMRAGKNWVTLTPRLATAGLLPKDQKVIDRILKVAP